MKTITSLERKTIETFKKHWDIWFQPTTQSIQEGVETWAEKCKGFGTGLHEIWRDRNDFKEFCEQAFHENPNGFKVDIKWVETDLLAENLVALWAEILISIEMPAKKIAIDPTRVTGVFKYIEREMRIIQWHTSVPDVSSEGELWPGTGEPGYYEDISVLFTDFVGFTNTVSTIPPNKLIHELNEIFAEFDEITRRHGLDKIKTIGDAYMAAGGLRNQIDHPLAAVRTAKDMLSYIQRRNQKQTIKWEMRVGIHCGPVVGGLIGSEKLSFDLWGDTVNLASRIESSGLANRINISAHMYELIKDEYPCSYRGKIEVKDKGKVDLYYINGPR